MLLGHFDKFLILSSTWWIDAKNMTFGTIAFFSVGFQMFFILLAFILAAPELLQLITDTCK